MKWVIVSFACKIKKNIASLQLNHWLSRLTNENKTKTIRNKAYTYEKDDFDNGTARLAHRSSTR